MYRRQILSILALTVITNASAYAQTAAVPKKDATVSVGWFGAPYPGLERYNRWHGSVFAGAAGGHYWTDHLKSEAEAAWLSRVEVDAYESEAVSDGTLYFRSSYRFQDFKLSFAQIYQFGDNAWVHPYFGAGMDIDSLRSDENRPAQVASIYTPGGASGTSKQVSLAALSERDSRLRARPFVKTGFKFYASDSTFFTTEWKFGLGNGLQHALWKTGIGIDF